VEGCPACTRRPARGMGRKAKPRPPLTSAEALPAQPSNEAAAPPPAPTSAPGEPARTSGQLCTTGATDVKNR